MLYCGISIDICESVFHYKSAKEIWDYLCCHYGSNEEISDLDTITNEETIEITKFKARHIDDRNNPDEKCDDENGDDKSEPHTESVEKQDREEYELKKNIQDLSTPKCKENEVENCIDNCYRS